ncbi:MAG: hypothetical protein GXO11_02435 [Epsilonproteobacteria bacterium]|nr:hypothetical protein [Campylobacterota bacterium]
MYSNEEAKILKLKIISALSHTVSQKSLPLVYLDEYDLHVKDTKRFGFILKKDCQEADIIFTNNASALPQECLDIDRHKLFTLSYKEYLQYESTAIGAFFWQKGRPNIILNRKLIQYYKLEIPKDYKKYIE